MAREPRALEPARTAARLVYSETDLEAGGQELYDRWAERAEREAERAPGLWQEDYNAICNAFKGVDNALKGLNGLRAEEGEDPINKDDLPDFFQESDQWELAFLGTYQGFSIRVWSFSPFDGQLAFALARAEDSVATFGTDIS